MSTTLASLVADVVAYCEESATVLPTATVESFLNRVKVRMQRRHGFQGQQFSLDLTYPANADSLPLPDDFIAEYGVWLLTATTPSRRMGTIKRMLRRQWIEGQTSVLVRDTVYPQTANPLLTQPETGYYLWGRALYLAPTPTADQALTLDYFLRMPDLTGAQNDYFTDVFPDVLLAGALAEAYLYLHEEERAGGWAQLFEARLVDAIRDDERLASSGPSKARGSSGGSN